MKADLKRYAHGCRNQGLGSTREQPGAAARRPPGGMRRAPRGDYRGGLEAFWEGSYRGKFNTPFLEVAGGFKRSAHSAGPGKTYTCHDQRLKYICSRCSETGRREDFQKTNLEFGFVSKFS